MAEHDFGRPGSIRAVEEQFRCNWVESLIESPRRTFVRTWYEFVPELKVTIERTQGRSLEQHIAILKAKDRREPTK